MKKKLSILIMSILVIMSLSSCSVIKIIELVQDITASVPEPEEVTTYETGENLKKNGPLTKDDFPSLGTPKLLVFPINLNPENKTDKVLSDINIAFNGTEEETGWNSVRSYYKKSSYGLLDVESTILNWYTPEHNINYYNQYSSNGEDGADALLKEVLNYYNDTINYADYDYDGDGVIDGIWLLYNNQIEYNNDDTLWWAFATHSGMLKKYDGKYVSSYAFASTDFMHEEQSHASYDVSDINVDAHSYIHETGHLMGLDDYYDYDDQVGPSGGLYSADMMDYTVGDHNSESKLLLGWVKPTVISETTVVELTSFTDTGMFLLISKDFSSIYSSYYLIEFYTSSGLNSHDLPMGSNCHGLRILEVHAEKNIVNNSVEYNSGTYKTGFKYDNSDEYKLFINQLRADNDRVFKDKYATQQSLYTFLGTQFGKDVYKDVFFDVKVNKMNNESCNITVTIK